MTMGLSEERGRVRRRRRAIWGFFRWVIAIGAIVAAGTWSYDIGTDLARQDVQILENSLTDTQQEAEGLRVQVGDLAAELSRVTSVLAQMERQVPDPEERAMLDLIEAREADGVDRDRIAFVLGSVADIRDCDAEPVTRRFIAKVAGGADNANDTVGFASNTITVTAIGQPARDAAGNIQGWFDPAEPLQATFTHISGLTTTAEGLLPLQHSVVVGDSEFQFTMIPGARSFVEVTADRCAFP